MAYEGPHIGARIARGLAERVASAGFANIAEAVGSE
jgi:dihydroorotate dehydrogenase